MRNLFSDKNRMPVRTGYFSVKVPYAIIAAAIMVSAFALPAVMTTQNIQAQAVSTWAKTLSSPSTHDDDIFRGLEKACDGTGTDSGYIIAAYTKGFPQSGDTNNDFWLTRIDNDGDRIWQERISRSDGPHEARSIDTVTCSANLANQRYIIAGTSKGDINLTLINGNGGIVWERLHGSSGTERAHAVIATSDGGFLVGGSKGSTGDGDFLVVKFDSTGENVVWKKQLGGSGDDVIRAVEEVSNGYIVAGFNHSDEPNGDIWVVKFDKSDGSVLWQKRYGGDLGFEEPGSILVVSDGVIIMEESSSYPNASPVTSGFLFKIDLSGNVIWHKTLDAVGSGVDELSAAAATSDGGFIVAGEVEDGDGEDFWLAKFDSSGNLDWDVRHGGEGHESAEDIVVTSDGGYLAIGFTKSFAGPTRDLLLLKVNEDGLLDTCSPDIPVQDASVTSNLASRTSSASTTSATPSSPTIDERSGTLNLDETEEDLNLECSS